MTRLGELKDRLCALGLVALGIFSSAHARAQASMVERYQLPRNGLRVVLAPDSSALGVSVVVRYEVGAAHDPRGYHGLSHLLEHLTFVQSQHLRPLQGTAILQSHGAESNAFTAKDATVYHTQSSASALNAVLWVESERMAFTLGGMSEGALLTEQRIVINEIKEHARDRWAVFNRAWLNGLYGRAHPFSPAENEAADVQAITLKDVQWFFQTGYRPDNATLVIAGSFEARAARDLVQKYFADVEPAPVSRPALQVEPPLLCGVHRVTINLGYPALRHLRFTWPLPAPSSAAARVSQRLLAELLSRRLTTSLERGQQASEVSVELEVHASHALFVADVALHENTDVAAVERAVLQEAARLGSANVNAREFRSARSVQLSSAVFGREDEANRAFALAKGDNPDDDVRALLAISAEEVRRVAEPLDGPVLIVRQERAKKQDGEVQIGEQNPCP